MTAQTLSGPTINRRERFVRIVLGVLGAALLIAFAVIELVPFVLTVANSFKCDAAVENRPMAFIPRLESITCRNEAGEFISAEDQVDGMFFYPSTDGSSIPPFSPLR